MLLPNATKYMNKFDEKIPQNKIEQAFWGRRTELQGWMWITIILIFGQDVQKSNLPIWWLVINLFVNISFLSPL